MKKILLMARDPGGANTIIPLVPALQKKGYQVLLYGKDAALVRYRQFSFAGIDIDGQMSTIDISSWLTLLAFEKPDFIITGTSGDDFSERYLWKAASVAGIKAFAILDQWINYGIRFSAYRPSELDQYEQEREHPYLPDNILVMDEEARNQLALEGIAPERVIISGQPYFDLLLAEKKRINYEKRSILRQKMGIAPEDFLLTFISEPLSYDYTQDEQGESYYGYDEKSICKQILRAVNEIAILTEHKIHFLVKQHPRESSQNYQDIVEQNRDGPVKLRIEKEIDSWSLLLSSDLLCGMSSMLLLESILLRRPTISVQIGLKRDNPFILDKKGILKSILQQDELKKCLNRIIIEQEVPVANWPIQTGTVDRVINYMEEILCPN